MKEFALASHSALAAALGCPSFMSVLLLEGARHCIPPRVCPSMLLLLELVEEPVV